ncbi:sulfotransferase 1C2 [Strongylocentrotus purpuratus]|uniref:Sulfotransferase domain-containing protein n=1 Tax=Strongylocentrotus purpuratus TaxID=7668 RepID=A0A7M7N0B5_STRPU|nr:sulfotransferase 1C2 [Strongylocentrotus purpuratus]
MALPAGMTQNPEMPGLFDFHEYEGLRMPKIVLKSSLDELKTFEVRPDDIWVCTYPKSGTHFIMEMTSLILADGDPMKIDRTTHLATISIVTVDRPFTVDAQQQGDEAQPPLAPMPFIDVIKKAPSPRKIACHLPFQLLPPNIEKRARVIYVARNPKDMIASTMRFVEKTVPYPGGFDQMVMDTMNGTTSFGPWFDHVMGYWKKRKEDNVLFLTFEEMKMNPAEAAQRVGKLLGRPLSPEILEKVVTKSGFEGMKKTYDKIEKASDKGKFLTKAAGQLPFMQKGVIGSWKERFTVAQNEAFDKWYQDKFAGCDLEFQFE